MKKPSIHSLLLLSTLLVLPSCDAVKQKVISVLDEKIEEAGGEAEALEHAGPQEAVRYLTEDDYDAFTDLGGYVVVVDFTADWCPPCKQLGPILEGLAESNDKVLLGKVDIDKNQALAAREKANRIPDVRIFVNGSKVDGFVGAPPADVAKQRIESQIENIKVADSPEPEVVAKAPEPGPQPKPQTQVHPKPNPQPEIAAKPEPEPEAQPEGAQQNQNIKPMEKDWLPPGIQRK